METIAEHIQDVTRHIGDQQTEIGLLSAKLDNDIIALSITTVVLLCYLSIMSLSWWAITGIVIAMGVAGWRTLNTYRSYALTIELMKNNIFYRNFITEEAYSGRTVDQG
jgi:hypothetical protein